MPYSLPLVDVPTTLIPPLRGTGARPETGPAARAPEAPPMTAPPLLLLSDHRGEGLSRRGVTFAAANFRVEMAANLRQTLAGLVRWRPSVVLVDPLAGGGNIELEMIERARSR